VSHFFRPIRRSVTGRDDTQRSSPNKMQRSDAVTKWSRVFLIVGIIVLAIAASGEGQDEYSQLLQLLTGLGT
jgi:hypothetical protein